MDRLQLPVLNLGLLDQAQSMDSSYYYFFFNLSQTLSVRVFLQDSLVMYFLLQSCLFQTLDTEHQGHSFQQAPTGIMVEELAQDITLFSCMCDMYQGKLSHLTVILFNSLVLAGEVDIGISSGYALT